jgi:hypothetical protein
LSAWIGPYKLKSLSSLVLADDFSFPEGKLVYIITLNSWQNYPSQKDTPLYVGQSGRSNKYQARARLGALMSCVLGFYNIEKNNRHKGGEAIFNYCKLNKIEPFSLYLSWKNADNINVEEKKLIDELKPIINQRNANSK